jgi:hypothetical protein
LAGKGLELLQVLVDHFFIPSTSVDPPDLFKQSQHEETAQKTEDLAVNFGGRVSKLAARSKRAEQAHTEVSHILTFINGLHAGFADFSKHHCSGQIVLNDTSRRDTMALAKTLERSMKSRSLVVI